MCIRDRIYNYYWWPSTVSSFTSDAIRWSVGDLGTGSDEWPNSGRTGSLWGSNCRYTFSLQSTPFPEAVNTYTYNYSITHDNYGD